ncbi:MAG: ABC transporter permease [Imperialibacter sp.]|uniref:ABC transporter permease n=1 Tax=Imperialibacter sp. TaxID=2038411 RepID=UPI0032EF6F6E
MFKNYLKLTVRNLRRNKLYVFINVLGLGISMACCIIAYLNTRFAYDFDKQHVNRENIYKVQINKDVQGQPVPYGITPVALGPRIAQDIPQVDEVVRVTGDSYILKVDRKVFNRHITFADPNFFDVFSFKMKEGSFDNFDNKSQLLLSEEMATAYFGNESATGKIITLVTSDEKNREFIVSGVLESMPENSTFQFDAITVFENFLDLNKIANNSWTSFVGGTFLFSKNGFAPEEVASLLTKYVPEQNQARPDWLIGSFYLEHMPDMPFSGRDIYSYWFPQAMHPAAIIAPIVMSALILLIACFNFTNTSIATSSKRLKEIGIRKVIGGNRQQLIIQFMAENLALCLLAIVVALGLASFLVPAYSAMWEGMTLKLDLSQNTEIYLFLVGLMILTAIIAGAYPSIYVSRYEPVKILRGSLKVGTTSSLSRGLLMMQFGFTIMALVASMAFYQNAIFQENADMGFEKESVVGARVSSLQEYTTLRSAMEKNPDVISMSGSASHIGFWNYGRTIKSGDVEREVMMMDFGPEYFETMDLKMAEGRPFGKDLAESDRLGSIIVNEKFVEAFGWKEAVGQRVSISDTLHLTVVGVIKNFYSDNFFSPIEPYAFRLSREDNVNFLIARVAGDKIVESYKAMEQSWLDLFPDKPFNGFYQEDTLKEAHEVNANIVIIFVFLGVVSVLLSVIGLFTLISLNVIKRVKEIGIRKVMGAEIPQILWLISKSFLLMVVVASALGAVGGYYLTDMLIESIFKFYKPIGLVSFLVPFLIILSIAGSTSFLRVFAAARKNPVDSLRYE